MTPTVDERLASIIRSLGEVVLPHLPEDASLAQEQVHLCIGHLQILRGQIDLIPAYEREELEDAVAIGGKLVASVAGGTESAAAAAALSAAVSAADGTEVRSQRRAILDAVDALVKAAARDGTAGSRAAIAREILAHEGVRARKDREWFAPYGFDTL